MSPKKKMKHSNGPSPTSVISVDPGIVNVGLAYAASGILKCVTLVDVRGLVSGAQKWCPEKLYLAVRTLVHQVPEDMRAKTQLVIENQFSLGFQGSSHGINEVVGAVIMAMRGLGVTMLRRMSPAERKCRLPLVPGVGKAKYIATKKVAVAELEKWLEHRDCEEHRAILLAIRSLTKKDDVCDAALNALVALDIL